MSNTGVKEINDVVEQNAKRLQGPNVKSKSVIGPEDIVIIPYIDAEKKNGTNNNANSSRTGNANANASRTGNTGNAIRTGNANSKTKSNTNTKNNKNNNSNVYHDYVGDIRDTDIKNKNSVIDNGTLPPKYQQELKKKVNKLLNE